MIKIAAPAKINLYLHVLGKQDNGFHVLDSLVVFSKFSDFITVKPSKRIKISLSGPYKKLLGDKKLNLVFKAASYLKKSAGIMSGAEIVLEKNLPVAAGLGGGSSDAAATIIALLRLWETKVDTKSLIALALKLGADVPVCLLRQAAFVGGIGEKIQPIKGMPEIVLVLINPKINLSTQRVFQLFEGPYSSQSRFERVPQNIEALVKVLHHGRKNDLVDQAVFLVPQINEILGSFKKEPKCKFASISGSGPTCFGIFEHLDDARDFVEKCLVEHPNWWAIATKSLDYCLGIKDDMKISE